MDNKTGKKKTKKSQVPISRLIVFALLFMVLFQAILFAVNIAMSGTNKNLLESNYYSVMKVTRNKRTQMERNMVNLWGNPDLMTGVAERVYNLRKANKLEDIESQTVITENLLDMINTMKSSAALLITDIPKSDKKSIIYLSDENEDINMADL